MSDGGVRPIRSSGLPTRLRLTERLDRGSFGEVWLARDTSEGVDVAVKFLDLGSAGMQGDRFEREARSLARLSGIPGIVTIRELGLAPDGTPWLVTEYLTGGSLRFKLDVEAPEPWSRQAVDLATSLLTPLATALAAAHELGVVHGDISPSNVLFDQAGRPYLSDFGLAELTQPDPAAAAVGDRREPRGPGGLTPAYASPERLRGAGPSQRSDVYALAATLWHVVTGEPRSGGRSEAGDARSGGRSEAGDARSGGRSEAGDARSGGRSEAGDARSGGRSEAGEARSGGCSESDDARSGGRSEAGDALVGVLESAMNSAPGMRPTALELSKALRRAEKPGRWWRYRQSDGKR